MPTKMKIEWEKSHQETSCDKCICRSSVRDNWCEEKSASYNDSDGINNTDNISIVIEKQEHAVSIL